MRFVFTHACFRPSPHSFFWWAAWVLHRRQPDLFRFPGGKRIIWTLTKDHPELANSNYSNPSDYPQGAELYPSNLDGSDVKRLTNSNFYDAEVSVAPNGKWILFGSQRSGKMELWRSDLDGSNPVQITHLDGWERAAHSCFAMARQSSSAPGGLKTQRPTRRACRWTCSQSRQTEPASNSSLTVEAPTGLHSLLPTAITMSLSGCCRPITTKYFSAT
jgi:WD40-like Beta Propeller Repeat